MRDYVAPKCVKVEIDTREAFTVGYGDGGCRVGAGWNYDNDGTGYCRDVGGPWQVQGGSDYQCYADNMGP